MSVEIKQLKENNVGFYPLTVGEAVILDNDVTVSAKISELESNSGSSVKYTNQSLTEDQKIQARKNQGLYYEEVSPAGIIEWDGIITDRDWFEHITE